MSGTGFGHETRCGPGILFRIVPAPLCDPAPAQATAAFIFSVSSLFVKILEQREHVPPGEIILVQGLCCWCSASVLLILEEKSVHSKTWRVAFLTVRRSGRRRFLGGLLL